MKNWEDAPVAIAYVPGWEWWHWALALLLFGGGVAGLVRLPLLTLGAFFELEYSRWRWAASLGLGMLALTSAGFALMMPGVLMRHQPEFSGSAWLLVLCLGVAFAAGVWGMFTYDSFKRGYFPGVVVGVGAAVGFAMDGINRAAASVPLSVGAFLAVVVVGVVFVGALLVERR